MVQGIVEMQISDWSDLGQESSNENEAPNMRNSGSTDLALWLPNMVNVSKDEKRIATKK